MFSLPQVIRPLDGSSEGPDTFDPSPYINDLFTCTIKRLKAADIDQEVKERAISCMGQIICNLGDRLPAELPGTLLIFLERLKNEITRLTTVKALTLIAGSPLKIDLRPVLPDAVPILASFLRKNQRALKLCTLAALDILLRNYRYAQNEAKCHLVGRHFEGRPKLVLTSVASRLMCSFLSRYFSSLHQLRCDSRHGRRRPRRAPAPHLRERHARIPNGAKLLVHAGRDAPVLPGSSERRKHPPAAHRFGPISTFAGRSLGGHVGLLPGTLTSMESQCDCNILGFSFLSINADSSLVLRLWWLLRRPGWATWTF